MNDKFAIIILNYNQIDYVIELIDFIENYEIIDCIIVIDNNSNDKNSDKINFISKYKKTVFIQNNINAGYATGNNLGIKYLINKTKLNYFVVCNPDVRFDEIILVNMLNKLKNEKYGIVGSTREWIGIDKKIRQYWHVPKFKDEILDCMLILPLILSKKYLYNIKDNNTELKVIPGCFWASTINVMKRIDYLDENTFLWYEENILASKLKKYNYKSYICSEKNIRMNISESSTRKIKRLDRLRIIYKSRKYYQETYLYLDKRKKLIMFVMMKYFYLTRFIIYNLIDIFNKDIKDEKGII